MNDAVEVARAAEEIIKSQMRQNNELHARVRKLNILVEQVTRQVEAARSLTETLEAEAHACPNQAHHRGWWHENTEDL